MRVMGVTLVVQRDGVQRYGAAVLGHGPHEHTARSRESQTSSVAVPSSSLEGWNQVKELS